MPSHLRLHSTIFQSLSINICFRIWLLSIKCSTSISTVHLRKARRSSFHHVCLFHSSAPFTEPRFLWWGCLQNLQNVLQKLSRSALLRYFNMCCDMFDQVKIELPTHLHEKHHLLFSFYHVTCDINAKTSSKKKEALETPGQRCTSSPMILYCACWNAVVLWQCVCVYCMLVYDTVGYAWLPLLKDGRITSQDFSIPVSCTLPGGYLLIKDASSTKVSTGIQKRK